MSVTKARAMYPEEKNISIAYERYLKEHPEEKFPARISNANKDYATPHIIAIKNRPTCPDCGGLLGIWEVNNSKKNMVGGDYKTQWICFNESGCGYQDGYSSLTVKEQIKRYADM